MRKLLILCAACVPLLLGLFTSAVAFEKKVVLADCFTATW
jgi:hypothetical protein